MSAEFALLEALRPRLAGGGGDVVVGFGDDAAVVTVAGGRVAFAVDAVVEGVHFDLGISSFADVGWKALAANVSDLAAVGAATTAAVVALHRPHGLPDDDVLALYDGLGEAAAHWQVDVVGGDVVTGPSLAVTVAVVGELLGAPLRRSGARPGDVVVLVGDVGAAAAGLALWRGGHHDVLERHPDLLAAHRRPRTPARAAAALVAAGAHAAIDVSDGLGQDAGHLATASGARLRIDAAAVPVLPSVAAAAERLGRPAYDLAVGGGDDLALLAAVAPDDAARLRDELSGSRLEPRVIGGVEPGSGTVLVTPDGREVDASRLGWEHGR